MSSQDRCNKTYTQLRKCTILGSGINTKIRIKVLRETIQPLGSPADILSEFLSREYQWSSFRTIPGAREWMGENWETTEVAYGIQPQGRRLPLLAIEEQYGTRPPEYQLCAPAPEEQDGTQLPEYQLCAPAVEEQDGTQSPGYRSRVLEIRETFQLPEETSEIPDVTQRCHSQHHTKSESTWNPLGVYFCVGLGAYLGTYFDACFGR
jgi:hypothetical protein